MSRKSGLVIALLLLCVICAVVILLVTGPFFEDRSRAKINAYTTPLEPAVAQELCSKLDLPEKDVRCQPGATVYATDFFRDMKRPFEYGVTTYEDVHALFGEYEFKCESRVTQADGYSYFRCYYDFNGDRMYYVIFNFSGDEAILDLILLHVTDSG